MKKDGNFSKNPLYKKYVSMKNRCGNPNNKNYKSYGGRGIKCLWDSFEEFRNNMQESYQSHVEKFGKENTSIDRINNDGNYELSNCRWATRLEQANNLSNNFFINFRGEKRNIQEWSRITGIKSQTIYTRFYRGWSPHKILTKPTKSI